MNFEKVKYGFFGNLEIFDKTAFSVLVANIDSCSKTTGNGWKEGIDKGKYGPMEETHGYLDQHWHVQAGLEGNPEGEWQKSDWTVKVDANAVFKPEKLISRIHLMPIPQKGGFLVNCEKVKYGFFGNLEVFYKVAFFSTLVANIDSCCKTTVSNCTLFLLACLNVTQPAMA